MARILGIIWIILGILWAIKPEILKNRLKKKIGRKIKWTVYGFLLIFGLLIVVSVIKMPGLFPKIIGLVGVIMAIKSIILMFSKTSDRLWEWWQEQPLLIFRLQALVVLAVGIMLVLA